MNTLEEYTNIAATVTELLGDGDEISLIDGIQSCIEDAKKVFADEQVQLNNEIERLLKQMEATQKKIEGSESKEEEPPFVVQETQGTAALDEGRRGGHANDSRGRPFNEAGCHGGHSLPARVQGNGECQIADCGRG